MKIKIRRVHRIFSVQEKPLTTVGYWAFMPGKPGDFAQPGWLDIEVLHLSDIRFHWAVVGHELIEAFYCRLFGISTEVCDQWDEHFEWLYSQGKVPKSVEAGDVRGCPYFVGHLLGKAWEHLCIRLTFASWERYLAECDRLMNVK